MRPKRSFLTQTNFYGKHHPKWSISILNGVLLPLWQMILAKCEPFSIYLNIAWKSSSCNFSTVMDDASILSTKTSLKWRPPPICRRTEWCLTACSKWRLVHPCHWKSHRSILSTPYIPLSLCSPVLSVCLSVFSPYTHHIHHRPTNVVKQRLAENQLLPYDQTASGFPHFNVIKVSKHPAGRPQLPLHKKPIQ